MDRKVLIAMVMIMMVLLLDQVISPKFYRPRRKPVPTQAGGTAGQPVPSSPGQGTAQPPAPAGGAPGGASSSGAPAGAASAVLSTGSVLTSPRVSPAPIQTREMATEHFRAE
ncbi:MAG TPA: hypothetical protein VER38_00955, partial [Candidatus Eisenbacteria bacterium]|nr:hypothetical protein [Candidatus Eisenbacteria bacterium]